ncbi:MAG: GNAT family N-acetyltransferase [Dehalococcoidales bacterium]|nr:GNAT family N-acetyltransferase [Dehalococcoidales bacterium]
MNINARLEELKKAYPEKFASEEEVFSHIRRGYRIFISTGCSEPQYLVRALIKYVESHPKAFFDTDIINVRTLGVTPYIDDKYKSHFRYNSFFVDNNTREAVNRGLADYTPVFLSQVPELFHRGMVPINVALVQTSLPDEHGYMSLGISVDTTKAAIENSPLVIAQMNDSMPRVHGDGFIHIKDVNFAIHHDEPLLEYEDEVPGEIAQRIGKYVARIVQDGDTIQVGYGSLPNAILANLNEKQHLGVHTELLTGGIVALMKSGVIDNSRKSINRGKSIATFCMGRKDTYEFINDNPSVEFRSLDYTNNPLTICQHRNMVAINSSLEIDLTGQATAESIGKSFYAGIGGQADFMRGATLAPGGKTILTLQSTAEDGTISRIVPFLKEGAGVTLNRGDIQYVVTEYGIAYLHGKSIRERAMELIAIAHPKFREQLIQEARTNRIIYEDQKFIAGTGGEYPEELEIRKTTKEGVEVLLRPVKISDEPLLKKFFYSLSDDSMYRRFISTRLDMPHERLQGFVVVDYTRDMIILALVNHDGNEIVVGAGESHHDEKSHTAEVAFTVRDDYQNKGIGSALLDYLMFLAKKRGLLGFTAEALATNQPMLRVFEKSGFHIAARESDGTYHLELKF